MVLLASCSGGPLTSSMVQVATLGDVEPSEGSAIASVLCHSIMA